MQAPLDLEVHAMYLLVLLDFLYNPLLTPLLSDENWVEHESFQEGIPCPETWNRFWIRLNPNWASNMSQLLAPYYPWRGRGEICTRRASDLIVTTRALFSCFSPPSRYKISLDLWMTANVFLVANSNTWFPRIPSAAGQIKRYTVSRVYVKQLPSWSLFYSCLTSQCFENLPSYHKNSDWQTTELPQREWPMAFESRSMPTGNFGDGPSGVHTELPDVPNQKHRMGIYPSMKV